MLFSQVAQRRVSDTANEQKHLPSVKCVLLLLTASFAVSVKQHRDVWAIQRMNRNIYQVWSVSYSYWLQALLFQSSSTETCERYSEWTETFTKWMCDGNLISQMGWIKFSVFCVKCVLQVTSYWLHACCFSLAAQGPLSAAVTRVTWWGSLCCPALSTRPPPQSPPRILDLRCHSCGRPRDLWDLKLYRSYRDSVS